MAAHELDVSGEKLGVAHRTEAAVVVGHDAAAERRVRRKLDLHMMPLFFVLYMFAFLDRNNLGNARIAGMTKDLDLVGDRYDWLVTIFYIAYIIFEFSLLLWKIFPPHVVCGIVVLSWGIIATVQSAAQSWGGLMAIRFLLGMFEAAYAPGIIYLLSFFYLRHEVGFRCGLFASAAPLASTFAGALAYGITSGHASLANWRLLFLVEGLATLILVPFAWMFTPDSPDTARFMNSEEKEVVKARVLRQVGHVARRGSLSVKEVAQTLVDPIAWSNALMYFAANVSYSSLPAYLPTILKDMGYTSIDAQGLSAPAYFSAFLCALVTTWIADRTQQRGLTLVATSAVGGIGYTILATVNTVGVRYFATFLAAAGVFSTIPNILAWTLNNQGSDSRRGAGLVLINVVGQCGPILGARIYPTDEKPRYVKGMSICAAFMFFTTLLSLSLRVLLVWKNRRLDRKYGKDTTDETTAKAVENYGPDFRYVL
ncbi:MFS general substrate transporter [Polyplosphaeria fusca]|uniref:MFS general substrate transporter n=1 Tax=Polyplosphaeria fusca TaxID=682080 RepID=A0A9P4QNS5_9PLEO|nr:MFS general substrate transporter [Polyplosphaeria fusca]